MDSPPAGQSRQEQDAAETQAAPGAGGLTASRVLLFVQKVVA